MGCGASLPATPPPGSPEDTLEEETSWKLWNALDIAEEADKTKLARFFSKMKAAGIEGLVEPEADADKLFMPLELASEASGLVLSSPLKEGSARDLLKYFGSGHALHVNYAVIAVREAVEVLKKEPNVLRVAAPSPESPVVVVGDLHGSFSDLNHILECHGWPGPKQRYIFNGDFVDRGDQGCEVFLVLLCLKALYPEEVFLVRGNHEDATISAAYGFKDECIEKFSLPMFSVFASAFMALPLCALMGEEGEGGVLVVHAGLPRDESVGFEEVDAVDRFKYSSVLNDEVCTNEFDDQLIEDLTWSDPTDHAGIHPNEDRGAGVFFGPDVTLRFLKKHGLSTLVRSHEAMCEGCEYVQLGAQNKGMGYWTVFSASNYSGSGNQGAVLVFSSLAERAETDQYHSMAARPDEDVKMSNMDKLEHFVSRRHFRLLRAFEKLDVEGSGKVSAKQWEEVMKDVMEMSLKWDLIRPTLHGTTGEPDGSVRYRDFLSNYVLGGEHNKHMPPGNAVQVSNLYENYEMLRGVFRAWDVNNDGKLAQQEFLDGVELINKQLPEHSKIDGAHIFSIIDMDNSGEIDLNEFCESYRLGRRIASPASPGSGKPMLSRTYSQMAEDAGLCRTQSLITFTPGESQ